VRTIKTVHKPRGELAIRTLAMPSDANPDGDIFGGWVLSQMDIAGGLFSKKLAEGRTVTVAIDSMTFHKPVSIGDVLCCFVELVKVGNTSLTVSVEAWAARQYRDEFIRVTEGKFVYVAIDKKQKPRLLPNSLRKQAVSKGS
jgi:acyl-CoA thioesterase YciA